MQCQGKHDWITFTEYNSLADEDIEVTRCAQCGMSDWENELPDIDWDNEDPWGV